jgi:membrane-associated phospholipid phosphatase
VSLGFLYVNLVGWTIWLLYPAAPPWYVDLYGTGPAELDVASNPAGLSRLDELVGLPIAAAVYSKSANVFGAMPSLHVAYACFLALVSFGFAGGVRIAAVLFAVITAFAALYLRHHYVLDVLAGAALAVFAFFQVRLSLDMLSRLKKAGQTSAAQGTPI